MSIEIEHIHTPTLAAGDRPATRRCLKCKTEFWSGGFGDRICKRCKGSGSWKNAAPSVTGTGGGRRSRTTGSGS